MPTAAVWNHRDPINGVAPDDVRDVHDLDDGQPVALLVDDDGRVQQLQGRDPSTGEPFADDDDALSWVTDRLEKANRPPPATQQAAKATADAMPGQLRRALPSVKALHRAWKGGNQMAGIQLDIAMSTLATWSQTDEQAAEVYLSAREWLDAQGPT